MIPLEKLLKRTRTNISQLESQQYDNADVCYKDNDIEKLYFIEHYSTDTKNLNLKKELELMSYLHRLNVKLCEGGRESIIKLPVHRSIKTVTANDRLYTVYELEGIETYIPNNLKEVCIFYDNIVNLISLVHDSKYYISNLVEGLFISSNEAISVSVSPAIIHYLKTADFVHKKSIIIGTNFISPFQILWDIHNSKFQSEEVEYNEFKNNFLMFWKRLLKENSFNIPEVCQSYYSKFNGGKDYIDFILVKWCKIQKKNGKTYIKKDPSLVSHPQYLFGIDWFCLGILLNKYVEHISESENTSHDNLSLLEITKILQKLTKTIYTCLLMEKPNLEFFLSTKK